MQDRIIAVNSNCYHGFSIEEAIAGIRAAGFHYVELTATKGWTEHVFPDQPIAKLFRVRELLKEADITPFAMSGHTNLMDPERIPDFIDNMRLAQFFGCRYIVSSIGEAHLADKTVASNAVVAEHVRALVPQLEEMDLHLVLETHGDHGTGVILKSIVDQVGSDRVHVAYDTANVIFYGDVDPVADYTACEDAVAYFHLKDKDGGNQEWNFPYLGGGRVNFPGIFRRLEENGSNAPFSIEIEFTQAGPKDLQEVNDAVRKSGEYLTACGFKL